MTRNFSHPHSRNERAQTSNHLTDTLSADILPIDSDDRIRGCLLGGVLACSLYDGLDHESLLRNDVIRIALLSLDSTSRFSDDGNAENVLTDTSYMQAIDYKAAQATSDTYPHPASYLSAAILCHILHRSVFFPQDSLSNVVTEALETVQKLFSREESFRKVKQLVRLAEKLSQDSAPDPIHLQALALRFSDTALPYTAFYCAFRYACDCVGGIQAAFAHNEADCFQTVLVGCVLGARVGYRKIIAENEISPTLNNAFHALIRKLFAKSFDSTEKSVTASKPDVLSFGTVSRRAKSTFIGAVYGTLTDIFDYDAVMHASHLFVAHPDPTDSPEIFRVGSAKIVCARGLPRRFVIEDRPAWQGGRCGEGDYIVSCYKACLTLAANDGVRRIAFLPVTVDSASFPLEYSVKIAVRTVIDFVAEHPNVFDKICWIVNDPAHLDACRKRIERYELERLAENGEF